ncbi:DMT family transporter [Adhaeretor mobilis]|uniref:DMT family transporter n=1 Tax=Adhaeretor mobilis TaxID=1930276 RepID=UPI001C54CE56|nr:DMT family transporter [Adhaeretor mobilis]
MSYFFFLFICVIWGASFILMDRALQAMGPIAVGLGRLIGGSIVVGLYCLVTRKWARLSRSDWMHIGVVAVLANSLPFAMQPYVMAQADEHAYFGLMVALVPIATILISIPMLSVHPTSRQLVGVLGGLACMGLIVSDGQQRGISTLHLLMALSVPVAYAIGNTYIKWKLDHVPTATLTLMTLLTGAAVLAPLQWAPGALEALGLSGPAEPQNVALAWSSLAVLSVLGTGVAILMFIHLIKTEGPLFAGMVTYVVPMMALVWGGYDKEKLTTTEIVGVAGTLAMVALVQWRSATTVVDEVKV